MNALKAAARRGVEENSKFQTPNSRKASSPNLQRQGRALGLRLGAWSLLGVWGLVLGASCFGAETLTYVDLIHRLTDLQYLATVPAPGDQCAQWSSYDRKSRYDAISGKYINWDAN